MATAELFDPRTGEWSTTGSMRYARAGAVAATLSDGRVLVVGSGPIRVKAGSSWMAAPSRRPRSTTRRRAASRSAGELSGFEVDPPAWARDFMGGGDVGQVGTLVALDDGGAMLVGHTEWQKHAADFSTSYRFDPKSTTWSEIEQAFVSVWDNGPRNRGWSSSGRDLGGAVAVKLADGRVLVAGGGGMHMESQMPIVRVARLYDPATNTWSKVPEDAGREDRRHRCAARRRLGPRGRWPYGSGRVPGIKVGEPVHALALAGPSGYQMSPTVKPSGNGSVGSRTQEAKP